MSEGTELAKQAQRTAKAWMELNTPVVKHGEKMGDFLNTLATALLTAEKRAEEAEREVTRLRKLSEDAHDGEWVDLADTIIATQRENKRLREALEEAEWALERAEPVVALAAEEHLRAARPTLVVVRGALLRLRANG